jgi:Tol biopolymer transport system component
MKTKPILSLLLCSFYLLSCAPNVINAPTERLAPTVTSFPIPTAIPSPIAKPYRTRIPILKTSHISGWAVYSLWLSYEPPVAQIFLKNLDTGAVTQLTNPGSYDRPLWSPDGSQIMYVTWSKETSSDIYVMDKDGKNQRPIVASPADEIMADWSPDGKKIVFVSNQDGGYKIYVIDLQTAKTIKLINDSMKEFSPKWSADGKQISFISNSSDNKLDTRSQVFIINADGTNIRQMMEYSVDNFDDSPVWCPDDECIIFMRFRGPLKVMILDISSKDVTTLLNKVFGPEISEVAIARSPISGYITFSASNMFYAIDMKTMEVYPLDIKASFLSLYP